MSQYLKQFGPPLMSAGYDIVPIRPGSKAPSIRDWQNMRAKEPQLEKWLANGHARGGVGVLTHRTPAIDIDVLDPDVTALMTQWCADNIGETVTRVGLAPKTLLVYRCVRPFTKLSSNQYEDFTGRRHRIEILGDGQQFVAFATHPDTNQPYEWTSTNTLADIKHDRLPVLTLDKARKLIAYFEDNVPADWTVAVRGKHGDTVNATSPDNLFASAEPRVDLSEDKIITALGLVDPEDCDHDRWVKVGMAIYHQFGGSAKGFDIWHDWYALCSRHTEGSTRGKQKWGSFNATQGQQPVTFRTVLKWAKEEHAKRKQKQVLEKGFRLIHAGDVLSKLGPTAWQITDFIEDNTTGLLFGEPGTYKSFLALDVALHVAAGKTWHDNPVKQGSVIYIAGEGHGGFARRLAAWQTHHRTDVGSLPLHFSQQSAHLHDEAATKQVAQAISRLVPLVGKPSLVVIDTLARNFGGGDENSTADMSKFINNVDDLIRQHLNTTVLIVHHTGHTQKQRARGAMALKGGIDFEYRMEVVKDTIKLSCTKMKDAERPIDTFFASRSILVSEFDAEETITSVVLDKVAGPLEEDVGVKGQQLAVLDIIEEYQRIHRDELQILALEREAVPTVTGFRQILMTLKKRRLIVVQGKFVRACYPPTEDEEVI